jgi:large conductance mechanosensitive channel
MARRRRVSGFMRDFQEFALKGNIVELAIAVIIGGAFGKIVTSFIEDIVTPLILTPALKAAQVDDLANLSINGIKYGTFLAAVLNFIVIAFVLFLMIRALAKFKREEAAAPEEAPVLDPVLVSQEKLTGALERLTQTIETQGR